MGIQNNINAKGIPLDASNSRGGFYADPGPYIGVVMDNKDATRTGRVRVWLRTHSSANRNDESHWRIVRYMTPFYGTTPHSLEVTTESNFENNGHAYGMWMTPPDLGVEVLCFFVDGDPNKGYYVGCIPEAQMNHMLPGTGAQANPDGVIFNNDKQKKAFENASQLPTIEIDRSAESMNDATFVSHAKPIHSVVAAQMWQAGTITDNHRGPITSSAQRESPSYAYGISTPGRPVLASGLTEETIRNALGDLTPDDLKVQGRRGGHSIVMDDGDLDGHSVLMRFRTSCGHQILLSDDGAAIHIIHANGQSWVELGNEGTIDVYGTNSINLRTQGELNLHADKNVNIHAGENFNLYAGKEFKIESNEKLDLIGKKGFKGYSESDVEFLAGKNVNIHSKGKTSIHAEQNLGLDGTRIDLNTSTGTSVKKPDSIAQNNLDETYFEEPYGWESQSAKLKTIATRAPTHEPYSGHNKGVPVKIETQSSSTSTTQKTNDQVDQVVDVPVTNPVTAAEVVKQIQTSGSARAIGACSTEQVSSIMAQRAKSVNQDVGTISEKGIGKFGLPPQSLETLGIVKPGMVLLSQSDSASLVTTLGDNGMFTGKYGINSLDDLMTSEETQSMVLQEHYSSVVDELEADNLMPSSAVDQGAVLAASTEASTMDSLKEWLGKGMDTASNIAKSARAGLYASTMAVAAGAKKLFTAATSSSSSASADLGDVTSQVGTVNRSGVDKATDELVGSKKIPSLSKNSVDVQNKIKLDSGQTLGITDALGNIVDKYGAVIATAATAIMVIPKADKALSEVPTTSSNVYSQYSSTSLDAFGNVTNTSGDFVGRFTTPATKRTSASTSTVSAGGSAARASRIVAGGVVVSGGMGDSDLPDELALNYYAQNPAYKTSSTGSEIADLKTYSKILTAQGMKAGSTDYYIALYHQAGVSGLTATQVANQLGITERAVTDFAHSHNLVGLDGFTNYYVYRSGKQLTATAAVTTAEKKTAAAGGAYDMKAYSDLLQKQNLSKDQYAKLILAKMKTAGLSPAQVDQQLGFSSGTSAKYIKDSAGGRKNVFK